DPVTRDELLSLSIETRRTLAGVINQLSAIPITPKDVQEQVARTVAERGLVDSSQPLARIISNSGLSPIAFTRALIWLNTSPGRNRMLLAKQGIIGSPPETFAGAYRALTGSEPIAPEISAWMEHTSEITDLRTIVSRATLQAYF